MALVFLGFLGRFLMKRYAINLASLVAAFFNVGKEIALLFFIGALFSIPILDAGVRLSGGGVSFEMNLDLRESADFNQLSRYIESRYAKRAEAAVDCSGEYVNIHGGGQCQVELAFHGLFDAGFFALAPFSIFEAGTGIVGFQGQWHVADFSVWLGVFSFFLALIPYLVFRLVSAHRKSAASLLVTNGQGWRLMFPACLGLGVTLALLISTLGYLIGTRWHLETPGNVNALEPLLTGPGMVLFVGSFSNCVGRRFHA